MLRTNGVRFFVVVTDGGWARKRRWLDPTLHCFCAQRAALDPRAFPLDPWRALLSLFAAPGRAQQRLLASGTGKEDGTTSESQDEHTRLCVDWHHEAQFRALRMWGSLLLSVLVNQLLHKVLVNGFIDALAKRSVLARREHAWFGALVFFLLLNSAVLAVFINLDCFSDPGLLAPTAGSSAGLGGRPLAHEELLRGETKGSNIEGEMGTELDGLEHPNEHESAPGNHEIYM